MIYKCIAFYYKSLRQEYIPFFSKRFTYCVLRIGLMCIYYSNTPVSEMDSDSLKSKANELWETIVRLETEKYDLEERQRRQDYDVSYIFTPKMSLCNIVSFTCSSSIYNTYIKSNTKCPGRYLPNS